MHAAGHPYDVLTFAEIDLIHNAALQILNQLGMEIQNQRLLSVLADSGLSVDFEAERVRFPPALVEQFIAGADKHDWTQARPHVSAGAGVYHGLYHDPASGQLIPWTEQALAYYFALARHLDHVNGASMLGCRLPVPGPLEPLYERYYCWKYGATEGGSIYTDEICPYLLELYQVLADARGLPLDQVFHATVYLVPALKLGRHEAYQLIYFWERGLRVGIGGGMGAMGATAPVTLAGAVTLNLAEQLALRILNQALFGDKRLHLGAGISVMDMRTAIRPYGRPEMALANLMTAQIARHYDASFSGQAGLTDAKLPSVEVGAQKALTALPPLLAGGSVWVDAGLLSIDEVFSPIQMILDNEFLSTLKRFTYEFQITLESIGLETIIDAGPGGHYLDKPHTVRYFREQHWEPTIWSRQMLMPWMEVGGQLDTDKARDVALHIQLKVESESKRDIMSDALEQQILRVIERARCALLR